MEEPALDSLSLGYPQTPASLGLVVPTLKTPGKPKTPIAELYNKFHDGDNRGAQHTCSHDPYENNTEGCEADDNSSRGQDSLTRISNTRTLPETTITFAQVRVPLVYGLSFAEEEPIAHVTMLADPSEPLLPNKQH